MSGGRLPSIRLVAEQISGGKATSRELVEVALERAADPQGEGCRVFTALYADRARADAVKVDELRKSGARIGTFAGVPITIKDLFDVEGETTLAGSKVLSGGAVAKQDAVAVARLRNAGFVVIGKTNMTEFAYSGLGLNPHTGTPLNPYQRELGRIPGGSSSGAAVSITDGMALGAIGTDTGGSCRIPAALCGIVGFKPTASRVPAQGMFPLSPALDSIGSLANSVDCCEILDAVMSGIPVTTRSFRSLRDVRLGIPDTLFLSDLDEHVTEAFSRAVSRIANAGAAIKSISLPETSELQRINAGGGFPAVESFAWHKELLSRAADQYDPRVLSRILRGQESQSGQLAQLHMARMDWIGRVNDRLGQVDALMFPTTPRVAPALSELQTDEAYNHANLLMLRNSAVINFLDGTAVSIPCNRAGEAPVGVTIAGTQGSDAVILGIGKAVERLLREVL